MFLVERQKTGEVLFIRDRTCFNNKNPEIVVVSYGCLPNLVQKLFFSLYRYRSAFGLLALLFTPFKMLFSISNNTAALTDLYIDEAKKFGRFYSMQ